MRTINHKTTFKPSPPKVPFNLAVFGYKPDPDNPLRYISDRGHPFYPVVFKDSKDKTMGDCVEGIAEAAYREGVENQITSETIS